jgi:catechol 2,3-dioxygenase-like lactoylglutathione lyase family enzyme
MLNKHQIIAFVATTDTRRAKTFYAKTLGLRLVSEDAFALVFDAAGTMLRVTVVQALQPAVYTILGWVVPDIRRAVRNLERRGVVFRRFADLEQDDFGVWSAPSGACVAWFCDPDGNTLSVTQAAPVAKRRAPARRASSSRSRTSKSRRPR